MVKRGNVRHGIRYSFYRAILFLLLLVAGNFIAGIWFKRFDFTTDKRFTLSPVTIEILNQIKRPLHIKVFLDGEMPPAFKRLKVASAEMLDEFSAYSHGNLTFEFINPSGSDDQQTNEHNIDDADPAHGERDSCNTC